MYSSKCYLQVFFIIFISVVFLFLVVSPHAVKASEEKEVVDHILDTSGLSHGICAMIGNNAVNLACETAKATEMMVHIMCSDDAVVNSVREKIDSECLYGKRIIAEKLPYDQLPYADNMIDLIIAVDLSESELTALSGQEMLRVLRPHGKAVLGGAKTSRNRLTNWLRDGGIRDVGFSKNRHGQWAVVTKPPLKGTDNWSHWEHGPDNNPVSQDTVIRAPYMSQWFGYPIYSAMPAITTAAGGRTFIAMGHIAHHEREEKWLNTLYARNGYNGTKLWERKLPDGYLVHRSAYVATDDVFYMIGTGGKGCLMLDPETGEELETIRIPEIRGEWKWMAIQDGILYALAGEMKDPPQTTMARNPHAGWSWDHMSSGYFHRRIPWGFGTTIFAYDLGRRRLVWTHAEQEPVDSRAMVMGGGKLFFYGPDSHLGCIDAKTGDVAWLNDDPRVRELIEATGNGFGGTPGFRTTCICMYSPDALFFEADARLNVVAVSTEDGRMLWTHPKNSNDPNMLFADGNLIIGIGKDAHNVAIDPLTGKTVKDLGFRKLNCTRMTGTPDSFFCRGVYEGLARYDRASGEIYYDGSLRPACNDGAIGANGLLYMGPWLCDCNLTLIGSIALCSAGEFKFDYEASNRKCLEYGTHTFKKDNTLAVTALDWPAYRANNDHSASSSATVSPEASRLWKYIPSAPYQPSTPTAAGGLIFLGGDDCKVRAIDAATGKVRWSYLTAGPIMRPPAIWNGRAYVGSGDGYIYCLDAANGELLWRFRAAPVERRIMVYGSLCSTWPVNSGVLVEDGIAYAAAGIIDFDGTYAYALDAVTGEIIWQNNSSGHLDKKRRKGVSVQGILTIADGRLWMAGGNMVSPASYDLASGKCLNDPPENRKMNRGEEIGVLNNRYIILGGRLQYSARKNVVNPGYFEAHKIISGAGTDKRKMLNKGKICPAWNDETIVFIDGRNLMPTCYSFDSIDGYLRQDVRASALPKPLWIGDEPQKPEDRVLRTRHTGYRIPGARDTVSLAIAHNAVLAVYETRGYESHQTRWSVAALDPVDGSTIWEHDLNPWGYLGSRDSMVNTLSEPALPGGLLVDCNGSVVVVLENGSVVCFGRKK